MTNHIPAFPRTGSEKPYRDDVGQIGMTLRDYFAGQALIALYATNDWSAGPNSFHIDAALAYKLADEMLKEREK